jgi:hypothetical protein
MWTVVAEADESLRRKLAVELEYCKAGLVVDEAGSAGDLFRILLGRSDENGLVVIGNSLWGWGPLYAMSHFNQLRRREEIPGVPLWGLVRGRSVANYTNSGADRVYDNQAKLVCDFAGRSLIHRVA